MNVDFRTIDVDSMCGAVGDAQEVLSMQDDMAACYQHKS